jgi:transposase
MLFVFYSNCSKPARFLAQPHTHISMESTGVYWKCVWRILQNHFELQLANPRHIKNIPGKKTDMKDAEWIARLTRLGVVPTSFVPPEPIQELRI